MPLLLKQVLSHPYFWMSLFGLVSILFLVKRKYLIAMAAAFISIVFLGVSTPIGSVWLLNQSKSLYPISPEYCKLGKKRGTILLPGGVYQEGKQKYLSHWSLRRAELVKDLANEGLTESVFIPGGNQLEGEKLKQYLESDLSLMFEIGEGSQSTYGNFLEIIESLNLEKEYWLVTSFWHYPRASRIAKKMGIKICPVVTDLLQPKGVFYHRDAHWQGKIAIHELIATYYYYVLQRI